MENDLDIRLKADRAFVTYLCEATGKSASALAVGAGMAATTLNRFVSRKSKLVSTLKDSTIQKIARRWGLDYLQLSAYRKKIEDAVRAGQPVPEMGNGPAENRSGAKTAALREAPPLQAFEGPGRDPLMDRIMAGTYELWFADYRDAIAFDRLPDLVRLFYSRIKSERKLTTKDIKKRASDMLAVAAMDVRRK